MKKFSTNTQAPTPLNSKETVMKVTKYNPQQKENVTLVRGKKKIAKVMALTIATLSGTGVLVAQDAYAWRLEIGGHTIARGDDPNLPNIPIQIGPHGITTHISIKVENNTSVFLRVVMDSNREEHMIPPGGSATFKKANYGDFPTFYFFQGASEVGQKKVDMTGDQRLSWNG